MVQPNDDTGSVCCMNTSSVAATVAEPITEPTWRVVLYTPDPAPVFSIGRSRIVVVELGAHTNAFPSPCKAMGTNIHHTDVSGFMTKK